MSDSIQIKLYLIAAVIAFSLTFSSCENIGTIDENEISPSINDAISILFSNNTEQNWTDTTVNFNQYFKEFFDLKTASYCVFKKNDSSASGLVLKITGYNSKLQSKEGKEIIVLKNFIGASGSQIEGVFSRQIASNTDENEKSIMFDGSLQLISQKNEIVYLHNLKQWTDGGITGIVEIKGKGRLLFERTGKTIFFEKRIIFD